MLVIAFHLTRVFIQTEKNEAIEIDLSRTINQIQITVECVLYFLRFVRVLYV